MEQIKCLLGLGLRGFKCWFSIGIRNCFLSVAFDFCLFYSILVVIISRCMAIYFHEGQLIIIYKVLNHIQRRLIVHNKRETNWLVSLWLPGANTKWQWPRKIPKEEKTLRRTPFWRGCHLWLLAVLFHCLKIADQYCQVEVTKNLIYILIKLRIKEAIDISTQNVQSFLCPVYRRYVNLSMVNQEIIHYIKLVTINETLLLK